MKISAFFVTQILREINFFFSAPKKADTPSRSKRVSWGPYVSPEYIDKTLPPSTPVKRGATPNRDTSLIKATPTSLLKKSLLQKRQMVSFVMFG